MAFKGPFQLELFHESMILCFCGNQLKKSTVHSPITAPGIKASVIFSQYGLYSINKTELIAKICFYILSTQAPRNIKSFKYMPRKNCHLSYFFHSTLLS